ncbi:hypothetical protein [Streptomyces sp. NP160]|uniref:hypothetical protein n=1 Tax=Streptomyces sp. NP160 TaxID=2586637 RepID=UPI00214CED57|nr:hypothetical protein [Streptomyces sp. NP160]
MERVRRAGPLDGACRAGPFERAALEEVRREVRWLFSVVFGAVFSDVFSGVFSGVSSEAFEGALEEREVGGVTR